MRPRFFSSRGHCGGALDLSAADARARGRGRGRRRLQSGRGVRWSRRPRREPRVGRLRVTHPIRIMVFELELPVATTETTIVKKAIVKSEARTQLTAAKKKKAPAASLIQGTVH